MTTFNIVEPIKLSKFESTIIKRAIEDLINSDDFELLSWPDRNNTFELLTKIEKLTNKLKQNKV